MGRKRSAGASSRNDGWTHRETGSESTLDRRAGGLARLVRRFNILHLGLRFTFLRLNLPVPLLLVVEMSPLHVGSELPHVIELLQTFCDTSLRCYQLG